MKRTVTTSGRGTVSVVPDAATVSVAARHQAAGVAEACAGADSATAAIRETAEEYADESKVVSTGFSVWPSHDHQGVPNGFEARHSLSIQLPDVPSAGRLLTALAERVGDRLAVDGLSLTVSEPGPAVVSAREAAFADARAKADALAGLAGAALGEVVSVVEADPGYGVRALAGAAPMAKLELDFAPGEQAIGASVTVTWRLA
jgi:uncharacterized protein YggE